MKEILFHGKRELTKRELQNLKLLGVGLVVIIASVMLGFSGEKKEEKVETAPTEILSTEKRLEEILSGVKGAGKVRVMIVYKDDGKENIAMNTEYSEESDGSIKTQSTAVLGGNREVIVVQKSIPEVQGVIVTAQGAEAENVRENIKKAVVAALPVLSHRIEVLTGE